MSGTPETDAAVMAAGGDWSFPLRECSRRLERQRDEAQEKYDNLATEHMLAVNKICNERDEAREAFVIATDQMVIAQGKVREANNERDEAFQLLASEKTTRNHIIKRSVEVERERDKARAALMQIEDLFIDGTDIYADREKMGCIAIEALKEAQ